MFFGYDNNNFFLSSLSTVTSRPIRLSTNFRTLIPTLIFTELWVVSMEHLQWVWHANRKRLPFQTPGSVPPPLLGTCLRSNGWDQIPRTWHVFTRLFTSNTPWYFLHFTKRDYRCVIRETTSKSIYRFWNIIFTDTCSTLRSSKCRLCDCYASGSISSTCDIKGQCMCKDKFYGRRCDSKDCEFTEWSLWSECPCGKRVETQRWRSLKSRRVGDGNECEGYPRDRKWCKVVKCDCKPGYYGNQCEKRDCVLHQWSSWSTCDSCPKKRCDFKCPKGKAPKKSRSRGVKVARVGGGIACSSRRSETNYCGWHCTTRCMPYPWSFICYYGKHWGYLDVKKSWDVSHIPFLGSNKTIINLYLDTSIIFINLPKYCKRRLYHVLPVMYPYHSRG